MAQLAAAPRSSHLRHGKLATERPELLPLGIAVVQDESAVDNVQQRPGNSRGRLAFRDGAFDLVVSRHEARVAAEVRRVLRSGGTYVTQQASSGSRQFHELLGLEPPLVEEFGLELAAEQVEPAGLLVHETQVGVATTVFADTGALAWYLVSVPWAVPGFSIDGSCNALMKLHGGPISVPSERFWMHAQA